MFERWLQHIIGDFFVCWACCRPDVYLIGGALMAPSSPELFCHAFGWLTPSKSFSSCSQACVSRGSPSFTHWSWFLRRCFCALKGAASTRSVSPGAATPQRKHTIYPKASHCRLHAPRALYRLFPGVASCPVRLHRQHRLGIRRAGAWSICVWDWSTRGPLLSLASCAHHANARQVFGVDAYSTLMVVQLIEWRELLSGR